MRRTGRRGRFRGWGSSLDRGGCGGYGKHRKNPVYHTIRLDGTLTFGTDRNTAVKIDTRIVSPHGHFEIGNELNPVSLDVKAKIIIANSEPMDLDCDPTEVESGFDRSRSCSHARRRQDVAFRLSSVFAKRG